MDIGLKSAFIISAIIHAAIAAPLYKYNLLKNDFARTGPVIVDYIILKEMSNVTISNTDKGGSVSLPETGNQEIKKAQPQINPPVRHDKEYYRKRLEAARLKEKKDPAADKTAGQKDREAAGKEARIKSSKDYMTYYGFLKDRIRAGLQENYKFYSGEGDVYLSFVISAKGALISYDIDRSRSSEDEVLLHITGASLKAASPFPPLPKTISTDKMSFSVTVSFRK